MKTTRTELKAATGLAALAAAMLAGGIAHAQSFPMKPVRLIVPYAAGGAVDAMARAFGQKLGDIWGQTVIVENRAGTVASALIMVTPLESSARTVKDFIALAKAQLDKLN